jgi:hypothetical protein
MFFRSQAIFEGKTMNQILQFVLENWKMLLPAMGAIVPMLITFIWARHKWLNAYFLEKINFSINIKQGDGHLGFRTIAEMDLGSLFDIYSKYRLMKLSRETKKKGRSFIQFENGQEAFKFLNVILNYLSAQFAEGAIAEDLGYAVSSEYLFGITCEWHPELNASKFRVMLIRPTLLQLIVKNDALVFANMKHNRMRRITLLEMAEIENTSTVTCCLSRISLSIVSPSNV